MIFIYVTSRVCLFVCSLFASSLTISLLGYSVTCLYWCQLWTCIQEEEEEEEEKEEEVVVEEEEEEEEEEVEEVEVEDEVGVEEEQ